MTDTRRFADRAEAERFLISQGFRFKGAPNRWRRSAEDGGNVVYAEIIEREGGGVVVLTTLAASRGGVFPPRPN